MPGMRYSRIRSAAGATSGEAVIPDLLVLNREWMAMGVAGMIITSDYGHFLIPC